MERVGFSERETIEAVEQVHLTQLAAGERTSVQGFEIEPGATVPEHSHHHEQTGFVYEGELTFSSAGNGATRERSSSGRASRSPSRATSPTPRSTGATASSAASTSSRRHGPAPTGRSDDDENDSIGVAGRSCAAADDANPSARSGSAAQSGVASPRAALTPSAESRHGGPVGVGRGRRVARRDGATRRPRVPVPGRGFRRPPGAKRRGRGRLRVRRRRLAGLHVPAGARPVGATRADRTPTTRIRPIRRL